MRVKRMGQRATQDLALGDESRDVFYQSYWHRKNVRGEFIGQAFNVPLEQGNMHMTVPQLSIARRTSGRATAEIGVGGAPMVSNNRNLVGFLVGQQDDEDYVLNAEDMADSGAMEFLSTPLPDHDNGWTFRRRDRT